MDHIASAETRARIKGMKEHLLSYVDIEGAPKRISSKSNKAS